MKTKEELNEIKEEVEKLDTKLHELTEEELEQVTGGGKAKNIGVKYLECIGSFGAPVDLSGIKR